MQGLVLELCHSSKEHACGLWERDGCMESHCGAPVQSLAEGTHEAETRYLSAHDLLHRVGLQKYNLG